MRERPCSLLPGDDPQRQLRGELGEEGVARHLAHQDPPWGFPDALRPIGSPPSADRSRSIAVRILVFAVPSGTCSSSPISRAVCP